MEDEVGCCGGDSGAKLEADLEAFEFPLTAFRGFPIRLAKDWELLETWSSATYLDLWERAEEDVVCLLKLLLPSRRAEYPVPPFRGCRLAPSCLVLAAAPICAGARGIEEGAVPFWSNRFFKSLTLG